MESSNFTNISVHYERDSLIQKSAAEKLVGLLNIGREDDVLDLGCGTGNLTLKLRGMTGGSVIGIDPSEGMIRKARASCAGVDIGFRVMSAEELTHRDRFSVIFANSAFQWFSDPAGALRKCFAALRVNGRMGIQAPAKRRYCPNFLAALDNVARDRRTAGPFSGFRQPWTFFDTTEEYEALFKQAGFTVAFSVIEEIRTRHAPGEVMTIFESGAAAGYLNRTFYTTPVDDAYRDAFREIVRESFREQAGSDGKVELLFNRIYLIAGKSPQE